jgi:hypothetical protein
MTSVKQAIAGAAMLGLAVTVPVRAGATASAAEIAALPWDESNITELRSASLSDVEEFVNRVLCDDIKDCAPVQVIQFVWEDLESNGQYLLVDLYGDRTQAVGIYWKTHSGKTEENHGELSPAIPGYRTQSIDVGGSEGSLTKAIRDLDGDGKKELIVNAGFGDGRSMAETPLTQWPMIYRLQGGKLVEASRAFPNFYDKEVLPPLDEKVSVLQKKLDAEAEAKAAGEAVIKEYSPSQPDIDSHTSPEQRKAVRDSEQLTLQQSLRDHILHVLGRNLTAEQEKEALEWLNSPDYWVVKYAEPTLEEIGVSRH